LINPPGSVNPSALISGRRGRCRFAGALAAAFFVIFSTASGQTGAETPAPARFVFWNLKNYLAMDRRVNSEAVPDAPKPEKEIAAVIDTLAEAKPDILGVCELGDARYLADLQTRLKARGVDLPHTELLVSADGWNRNVALLSRFPIVARQSRADLTYMIGQTRLPVQRGILDVTLAPNEGYRLRCIGIHLKSKREVPEANEFDMRRNEAHLVREHINAIFASEPGANLLVFGDFNDTPDQPAPRTIRGKFGADGYLADLRPADSSGFKWTHYWSFADTYARIDYLLASDGLQLEIVRDSARIPTRPDWDVASDHRPLQFELIPKDRASAGKK
jgi:endonuclease/exonuclease/phosphatase family metal-dependent hydrolase